MIIVHSLSFLIFFHTSSSPAPSESICTSRSIRLHVILRFAHPLSHSIKKQSLHFSVRQVHDPRPHHSSPPSIYVLSPSFTPTSLSHPLSTTETVYDFCFPLSYSKAVFHLPTSFSILAQMLAFCICAQSVPAFLTRPPVPFHPRSLVQATVLLMGW